MLFCVFRNLFLGVFRDGAFVCVGGCVVFVCVGGCVVFVCWPIRHVRGFVLGVCRSVVCVCVFVSVGVWCLCVCVLVCIEEVLFFGFLCV